MKKISEFFNACAEKGRKSLAGLTAGFVLATGAAVPALAQEPVPSTPVLAGATYWKHPDYNIVAKIEPCDEKGLCMSIASINPDDPKVKELLAELTGRARKDENGRWVLAPEYISRWEALSYCNFSPETKLKKDAYGAWDGTIRSPFNYESYGLGVTPQSDGTLKVSGYPLWFPLFSLSIRAEQVAAPPTSCSPAYIMAEKKTPGLDEPPRIAF